MRTEIPVCKRCCFCVPLRYGLVVWGYLRLVISILLIISLSSKWYTGFDPEETNFGFETADFVIAGSLTVISIADFLLTLVFIVGCHKKNVKLMKIFYFYSQVLLGLTTAITLYQLIWMTVDLINYTKRTNKYIFTIWLYEIMESIGRLANLILQLYMILLIRSEIIKLTNTYQLRFTNVGSEPQCTLNENNLNETNETSPGQDNAVTINTEDITNVNKVNNVN